MNLRRQVWAKYIGPAHPAFGEQEEQLITLITQSGSPELVVLHNENNQEIRYPSLKKFKEQWDAKLDQATVIKEPKKQRRTSNISIADAGGIIYTEIVSCVNRANGRFAETYKDKPWEKPEFEVSLKQEVYPEDVQESKNLYGAAVLRLEIKQFGLKRVLFQEGVSFRTEKELDNTNGYAPKLYLLLLDTLIETSLLYALALNPDNLENVQALQEDVPGEETKSRSDEASNSK